MKKIITAIIGLVMGTVMANASVILVSQSEWTTAISQSMTVGTSGFSGTFSYPDDAQPRPYPAPATYGSTDGSFGTFEGASTVNNSSLKIQGTIWSTNNNAGLADNIAFFDITVTNNSGNSYKLDAFHFDEWAEFSSSPGTLSSGRVSVEVLSGSQITTGSVSTVTALQQGALSTSGANFDDFDISLAGLADNILSNGESVTFRVSLGVDPTKSSASYIDNIAITGSIIPEPATLSIFVIGCVGIMALRHL